MEKELEQLEAQFQSGSLPEVEYATKKKKLQDQAAGWWILEWLQTKRAEEGVDQEGMDVAIDCLKQSLGLDTGFKPNPLPVSLPQALFGYLSNDLEAKYQQYFRMLQDKGFFKGLQPDSAEYKSRADKAREMFLARFKPGQAAPAPAPAATAPTQETPSLTKEQAAQQAEQYKLEGNQKLGQQQFSDAIQCYTKAIELNPSNPVYYANRAAAHSHLDQHQNAIEDCQKALQVDPNYTKTYSRLGFSYFSLGKYAEAVQYYEKALKLEPTKQTLIDALQAARDKLQEQAPSAPRPQAPPGLADMLNNPGLQNLMGGVLNNPDLMNLATQAASQPGIQQMLNDPNTLSMMQSFLNNPEMLSSLFGGAGPK